MSAIIRNLPPPRKDGLEIERAANSGVRTGDTAFPVSTVPQSAPQNPRTGTDRDFWIPDEGIERQVKRMLLAGRVTS
jgi:hypothetical protein